MLLKYRFEWTAEGQNESADSQMSRNTHLTDKQERVHLLSAFAPPRPWSLPSHMHALCTHAIIVVWPNMQAGEQTWPETEQELRSKAGGTSEDDKCRGASKREGGELAVLTYAEGGAGWEMMWVPFCPLPPSATHLPAISLSSLFLSASAPPSSFIHALFTEKNGVLQTCWEKKKQEGGWG